MHLNYDIFLSGETLPTSIYHCSYRGKEEHRPHMSNSNQDRLTMKLWKYYKYDFNWKTVTWWASVTASSGGEGIHERLNPDVNELGQEEDKMWCGPRLRDIEPQRQTNGQYQAKYYQVSDQNHEWTQNIDCEFHVCLQIILFCNLDFIIHIFYFRSHRGSREVQRRAFNKTLTNLQNTATWVPVQILITAKRCVWQ